MSENPTSLPVLRIDITVTGEGDGVRRRILEADTADVDTTTLMARLGAALPEFRTVDWYTDY